MEFVQCGLEMLDRGVVRSVFVRSSGRKSCCDILVIKWTLGGGRSCIVLAGHCEVSSCAA